MWVRLKTAKNVLLAGTAVAYRPGDLVEVGKHRAREWVAAGDAEVWEIDTGAANPPTAGIACYGGVAPTVRDRLAKVENLRMSFHEDAWPLLAYSETLLWVPEFEPRMDHLMQGYNLLKRWQVAVPLWDYDVLARDVGSDEERVHTETVIRDLRVPLRDTRLVFVRRCPDTRRLVETWHAERARFPGGEDKLAFLRALYLVKPLVCDLPTVWTNRGRLR